MASVEQGVSAIVPVPAKEKASKKKASAKPKVAPSHPPYIEMIKEAIIALKERTGSSQIAIAKFIEEKHKSHLPPNFKKLLLVQLKKLVASGKLVKVKGSFKLPAASKPAAKKPTGEKAVAKKKAAAKPKAAAKKPASAKAKGVAVKSKVTKPKAKAAKTSTATTPGKKPAAKVKKVPAKGAKKPKSIKVAKKASAKKAVK